MSDVHEFHYRLPARVPGQRPGAHHGASLGTGQQFAAHRRLFDHPDPRRLDLRASLRDVRREWLVRIQRQRTAVPVHAMVDVSASMHFGVDKTKLEVAADFVEALGRSAFRSGDALGLLAFDAGTRADLFMPASPGPRRRQRDGRTTAHLPAGDGWRRLDRGAAALRGAPRRPPRPGVHRLRFPLADRRARRRARTAGAGLRRADDRVGSGRDRAARARRRCLQ